MSDKVKALYQKLYDDIAVFGKACFPTAITATIPEFHREIYKNIADESLKRLLIASFRGSAKRLAIDAKILTPSGWVENGSLSVGDYVIGSNGKPTKILHMSEIVKRPLYRLTTRDGRSVLCDSEHLWKVRRISGGAGFYKNKDIVMTTQELLDFPYKGPRIDNRNGEYIDECYYAIDNPAPTEFGEKHFDIAPYDMGVILGDGNISKNTGFVRIHSSSFDVDETYANIEWNNKGEIIKDDNRARFSLRGIGPLINKLGLLSNVYGKHIPQEYLHGSIEQRTNLLQGLMDTDGTCSDGRRGATYVTVSKQLAEDFVYLVRSLGGTAGVGKYRCKLSTCDAIRISVSLPSDIRPFRMKRKVDKYVPARRTCNAIVSIEYEKDDYGRCLMVDAEDHLFITEDFLLTHNSTLVSLVYPLWRVAFKKPNEDLFIIIVSEAQGQSINFLNRIKYHLEKSQAFKMLFGDFGPSTAKRWTQNDIILANGSRIVALGTGQRIRGAIEGDTRPNVIILDDIESELNAATSEARASNRMWITDAVIPSLADNGRIIMIGTVIHEDCFLCWAKGSTAWKVLWYGILDENNNPIWTQRFPMERVLSIKEEFSSVGNLNGFYQEYMNIAQAPDSAPFKPSFIHLHEFDFEFREDQHVLVRKIGDDEIIKPINVYMGIDPASVISKTSDYFVIAVIGVDSDDNAYVVDIFRDKISPSAQPEKILEFYSKYKPHKTKIETVGYQEALRTGVRALMKERGIYIAGIEAGIKPRTAKSERLISMVPRMARGKFFFRPQDIAAQQEFLSYPSGRNDDIMDAIYFALDGSTICKDSEFIEGVVRKRWRPPNWLTQ